MTCLPHVVCIGDGRQCIPATPLNMSGTPGLHSCVSCPLHVHLVSYNKRGGLPLLGLNLSKVGAPDVSQGLSAALASAKGIIGVGRPPRKRYPNVLVWFVFA